MSEFKFSNNEIFQNIENKLFKESNTLTEEIINNLYTLTDQTIDPNNETIKYLKIFYDSNNLTRNIVDSKIKEIKFPLDNILIQFNNLFDKNSFLDVDFFLKIFNQSNDIKLSKEEFLKFINFTIYKNSNSNNDVFPFNEFKKYFIEILNKK